MSVRDWLRGLFSGPKQIDADAAADIDKMADGRALNEPYAAMEASEAAEAEIESEE